MKKLPILLSITAIGALSAMAYAAYSLVYTSTIPWSVADLSGTPPASMAVADLAADPSDEDGNLHVGIGTVWVDLDDPQSPVFTGTTSGAYADMFLHQVSAQTGWTTGWARYDGPDGEPHFPGDQHGNDYGREVAYDSNGNIFAAIESDERESNSDIDPIAARVRVLRYCGPLSNSGSNPSHVYTMPHTVDFTTDQVADMIVADDDSVYLLARQQGDMIVVKLDPTDLSVDWDQVIDSGGSDHAVQIVHRGDYVYVVGQNSNGFYFAKLEEGDGDIVWEDDHLPSMGAILDVKGITVDSSGVCYATATDSFPIEPQIVTIKISSAGVVQTAWTRTHNGPNSGLITSPDRACGITIDSSDRPIVGGYGFMPGKSSGGDTDYIALRYTSSNSTTNDLFVGYNTVSGREERAVNVMVDSNDDFHVFGPVFSGGTMLSIGSVVWDDTGTFQTNSQLGGGTFSGTTITMLEACNSALGFHDRLNTIFMYGMAHRTNGTDHYYAGRFGAYEP